ncbi:MAG: cell division protein CrgA [Actinomycetota bacterium]
MVRQDKSKPGRVTPKGSGAAAVPGDDTAGPSGVGRTPVNVDPPSSAFVPILMFAALGLGTVVILFNYLTEDILGTPSNWYLLGGLGLILVGIIAATQYR